MSTSLFTYNLLLHITVFIFGFTGILGRLISIPGDLLVWYRTLIAVITIFLILIWRKTNFRIPVKEAFQLLLIGGIVGAHWVTFFHAIKISNVSITLACLSVTTLVVSVFEPLFFKTRISFLEVFLGGIIIAGLWLIGNVQFNYLPGILVGLTSAFLSGMFTILNKRITHQYDGFVISWYEMIGAFVTVGAYIVFTDFSTFSIPVTSHDWIWLIVLGTICTAFAYWCTVTVLKKLSAYAVVMAINLEPVYGTILAAFIFNEHKELNPGFYLGSFIIIFSVFTYSIMKQNNNIIKSLLKKVNGKHSS